jgi:hypothetical protein
MKKVYSRLKVKIKIAALTKKQRISLSSHGSGDRTGYKFQNLDTI